MAKDSTWISQTPLDGTEHRRVANMLRVDPTYENEEAIDDSPENYVMENFARHVMRPRAMSHHLFSSKTPSRNWLIIQARFWRACMSLGMQFHGYPSPKPTKPAFVHKILTDTIPIELYFYVPSGYHATFRDDPDFRYPIIVNFHGGGFCLGHATDDRYYARVMLAHTSAVFVSVGYRKAPEHPFPIPLDDCVEAVLYLAAHADDYHIDPSKIALTGFSAGANLSLTAPFRLAYHDKKSRSRDFSSSKSTIAFTRSSPELSRITTQCDSPQTTTYHTENSGSDILIKRPSTMTQPLPRKAPDNNIAAEGTTSHLQSYIEPEIKRSSRPPSITNSFKLPGLSRTLSSPSCYDSRLIQEQSHSRITRLLTPQQPPHLQHPDSKSNVLATSTSTTSSSSSSSSTSTIVDTIQILTIISWYPLLDWTTSRSSKRRNAINPTKTLSPIFTDLFDHAYLPPPDLENNHASPYASPCLASDKNLVDGLPHHIQLWLCEYDMLLAEGRHFSSRLTELGKDCFTTLIERVPHGWDKSPNPFRDQAKIDALYVQAAERCEAVFRGRD